MMARKCDRCGKLYEVRKKKSNYRLSELSACNSRYYKPIDLCPECLDSLKLWFDKYWPKK